MSGPPSLGDATAVTGITPPVAPAPAADPASGLTLSGGATAITSVAGRALAADGQAPTIATAVGGDVTAMTGLAGRPGPHPAVDGQAPTVATAGLEAPAAPALDALLGRSVGGCHINALLGRGGMGAVFRATQTSLGREVALKTMLPDRAGDQQFLDRFVREARVVARLSHPHVVQIFDAGRDHAAGGLYYIIMEFVAGRTLGQVIKAQGALSVPLALAVCRQAAEGLAAAHAQTLVHRDIKPDNLMIDRAGRVKVMDFGLARGTGGNDAGLTQSGAILGTPNYISPEAARGEASDIRSDLYSLGVTLWQMIAGRLPFSAPTPVQVMVQHLEVAPRRLGEVVPGCPPAVADLVAALLAKDAAQRPQDPAALIAAIERIEQAQGGAARLAWSNDDRLIASAAGATTLVAPPSRPRRWPWLVAAAATAIAVATWALRPAERAAEPAAGATAQRLAVGTTGATDGGKAEAPGTAKPAAAALPPVGAAPAAVPAPTVPAPAIAAPSAVAAPALASAPALVPATSSPAVGVVPSSPSTVPVAAPASPAAPATPPATVAVASPVAAPATPASAGTVPAAPTPPIATVPAPTVAPPIAAPAVAPVAPSPTAPPAVAAPAAAPSPITAALPPGAPPIGTPELTTALAAAKPPAAPARAPTPARLINRLPAGLSVTSLPSGAEVHIDGLRRGVTPLLLRDLGPGRHEVRLLKPGQLDERVTLLLPGAQVTRLSNPLPQPATLTLSGYPAGAAIAVSGLAYEPGMPLPPGMAAVVVAAPGAEDRRQVVELQPGDNPVTLTP